MSGKEIILGTANFLKGYAGSNVDYKQYYRILGKAQELGINTVDTSPKYGAALGILSSVGGFNIILKVSEIDEIKKSLDILSKTKVYAILDHSPWKYNKMLWEVLNSRKYSDLKGMSIYGEWDDTYYDTHGHLVNDIIQYPNNIFTQCECSSEYDVHSPTEYHVRSIFLQGVAINGRHLKDIPEVAKFLDTYKTEHDRIKAAISYICSTNAHRIVVGVDTPEQLQVIYNCVNNDYYTKFKISNKELVNPRLWNK